MPNNTLVLVTGASGYLGAHCVKRLLEKGYKVRGTVRNLLSKSKVDPLKAIAAEFPNSSFELVEADLLESEKWIEAVKGCKYVLHVASPFPIQANELTVETAVKGTLNVLSACASKSSQIKKVVVTSSCSAINGHNKINHVYNEEDWSLTDPKKVMAYPRSKTEAEKAAWNFVKNFKSDDNKFDLTCLNPTLIVGPILFKNEGTSISIIRRFLSGDMPVIPALQFGLVDVRDVAEAHLRAMETLESNGHRILVSAQPSYWFREIAFILGKEFHSQGYYVPRYEVPNVIIWLCSFFDSDTKESLSRLGKHYRFDTSKVKKLLNMNFIKPETSLIEMGYSLIEHDVLPKKLNYKGPPK